MSYVSLYRKYRSQGFDEILGQRHVTQTLRNALSSGRIAHAYLFTGPRGTGKTSTARVLAKALNCKTFDGPTPDPCGTCEACIRIRDGYSMDVMEIDAASTRGIDDIRDLREKVKFAPAEERYKVYVIDEVHQLTGEAFNALLKTLEEPPSNVVFILATTELHKVPATILSRCQRFDFRRGSLDDLKGRIQTVGEAEGWEVTPEAVTGLALAANGGYRDALSLLEQVAAFATDNRTIDMDAVNTVLGAVGRERLLEVGEAVARQDAAACFRLAGEALADGVEVRQFLSGLRRHFRDVLMAAVGAEEADSTPGFAEDRSRLKQQADAISMPTVLWCIDQLNEAERDLRWAPQQRLLLETTLVKLATARLAAVAPAEVPAPPPARQAPRAAPERPAHRQAPPPSEPPPMEQEPPLRMVDGGRHEEPPAGQNAPGEDDFDALSRAWTIMVNKIGPSTRVILENMRPVRLEGGVLVVSGQTEFNVEKANKQKGKLEATFEKAAHRKVAFRFIHEPAATPAAAPQKHTGSRTRSKPAEVSLEDLATRTFDATVVDENDPGSDA